MPYGDLAALSGTLAGTLLSGDPLDVQFYHGRGSHTGSISLLIPEPATAVFVGCGLAGFAAAGRRRSPD